MKILVALDGSDAAFNAMRSACSLALRTDAQITVFYVNKGEEYTPEETGWLSIKDRISREMETFGHEVIYKAYAIGKEFNVPVEGRMSYGIPAHEILKYTSAYGIIKLIVMAHSSKGKGTQEFVESTTKIVVAGSNIPVYVTDQDISPRRILLAVDDSEGSRKAAAYAGKLAKTLGADLQVLSVIPDAENDMHKYSTIAEVPNIQKYIDASERDVNKIVDRTLMSTREILSALGISAPETVRKGRVSEEIISEAKNYDLLIIGIDNVPAHKKPGRTATILLNTHAINAVFVQ
jgi:nucleotide-binding universal stress UspA family protein